jgi:hypothetical protein
MLALQIGGVASWIMVILSAIACVHNYEPVLPCPVHYRRARIRFVLAVSVLVPATLFAAFSFELVRTMRLM